MFEYEFEQIRQLAFDLSGRFITSNALGYPSEYCPFTSFAIEKIEDAASGDALDSTTITITPDGIFQITDFSTPIGPARIFFSVYNDHSWHILEAHLIELEIKEAPDIPSGVNFPPYFEGEIANVEIELGSSGTITSSIPTYTDALGYEVTLSISGLQSWMNFDEGEMVLEIDGS